MLREEELRERERLEQLEEPGLTQEEMAGLQGRFNIERRLA